MRSFRRDQRGFVLVFALLVLPVFIGYAFIIIDIGRGNNAHADLAAAADAVALAGARELDGGPDAIDRAKAAMANLTNTVSMLATSGSDMEIALTYADTSGNEFGVTFLTDIPVLDTTPITAQWLTNNRTTNGADATYVYVHAQSRDLRSAFFNPGSMLNVTIPVAATAVAKSTSAVCDIPPLYICNPFEFDSSGNYVGDLLQSRFAAGDLHGRMVRLHPAGNNTHIPGNFGYLAVNDPDVNSGARAISDLFAGAQNGTCYESGTVETKPGASNSIRSGLNTRFDIYLSPYQNGGTNGPNSFTALSSGNVRKGIYPRRQGNNVDDCVAQGGNISSQAVIGDDHVWDPTSGFNANGTTDFAYGFPDNNTMVPPNDSSGNSIAGAYLGNGPWNVQEYLDRNYGITGGTSNVSASTVPTSFPGANPGTYTGPGFTGPSRYDVYQWEYSNGTTYDHTYRALGDPAVTNPSPNGESGEALCAPGSVDPWEPSDPTPDPRVIVAAIIDCETYSNNNGRTNFPVNSYASIFMTRPMMSYGPSGDMTIDVEFIDITGFGGNGTLDVFIREEAILVR